MKHIIITIMALAVALGVMAKKPLKVACVGNSITFGLKLDDPAIQSYPSQLSKMLGDGYEVGNFGKSGATLLRHGHRPYNEQEEYRKAIEFAGDIVVIHLGVNDTDPRNWPHYADEFVDDYLTLIDSLKAANPAAKFYIARLSPISNTHPRFQSGTRDWRLQIQVLIENVAAISGATLIDFEEPLIDKPYLIPDGIHPNQTGAALLAQTVYKAITGDFGGLKMPMLYTDHMVLPYGKRFTISGTADAGDNVKVTLGSQTATTKVPASGKWSVEMLPLTSKGPYTLTVSDGKTSLKYDDVAAGVIWLCSGQSNMEFTLQNTTTASEDIPSAANRDIRFFDMKPRWYTGNFEWPESALDSLNALEYYKDARWEVSSPETAARFSAIGYYFGKELCDSLNLPVGLINNAVGGSATESWVDRQTLEARMPMILNNPATNDFIQPWVRERASKNIAKSTDRFQRHPYHPAYLFESGIKPLEKFPIDGVIWYQGESNAHNIEAHYLLFNLLIDSWNRYWERPDNLPFYFVQLSSLNRPSWPEFRDSQRLLAANLVHKKVGMVVSSDLGDSLDVHPRNKRPIGHRLAAKALEETYNRANVNSLEPSPVYAELDDSIIVLHTNYGEWLPEKYSLTTSDGKAPSTFEVAEYDGRYYPATAEIDEKYGTIIIRTDVKRPRFVRYGWQPFTRANVTGSNGHPMSTFKIIIENSQEQAIPMVSISEFPQIKGSKNYAKGISACFAGKYGDYIVVAGGANFPGKAAADGGEKMLYDDIYVIKDGESKWTKAGSLNTPTAYGASVTTSEGIVLTGGLTPEGKTDNVMLLTLNAKGKAELSALPSLPCPSEQLCAALYKSGVIAFIPEMSRLVYLDLTDLSAGWQEYNSLDYFGLQSTLATPVLDNEECIAIAGGFVPATQSTKANFFTDMSFIFPGSGFLPTWGEGKFAPAGQTAILLGGNRIVYTGGVNAEVFEDAVLNPKPDYLRHDASWYKFSKEILLLDCVSKSIVSLGAYPETARAGAATVALDGSSFLLINGELKPGVRTPSILRITLE